MTDAEMAENLRAAKRLVEAVYTELDDSSQLCGQCGLRVYGNWRERNLKERAKGLLQKLGALADILEKDDGHD